MPEIEIEHYDRLNGTPAARLAVLGWADVDGRGLGEPGGVLNMHHSYKAFVGVAPNGREQLPVGVLTYILMDGIPTMWIMQAFVIEEFRGRGVYTAMFNAAIAKAIELKQDRIQFGTHVRNIAMREIAKRHGGVETCVTYNFEVPKI